MSKRRGIKLLEVLIAAAIVAPIAWFLSRPTSCGVRTHHSERASSSDGDETSAATAPSGDATSSSQVTVTPVDKAGFDATLAELRGKVVLVDYWATWCLPCVQQLPHTLELGRKLGDRGLVVVTVSCNQPEDVDQVIRFLGKQQLGDAINLISKFGSGPQTIEDFGITSGGAPFYQLFDRSGRMTETFGADPRAKTQYTDADIEAAIERRLAQ